MSASVTATGGMRRVASRASARPSIVYVIDSLVAGGAERHLVRLVHGMVQTGRWDVSVVCLARVGAFLPAMEDTGVELIGPADDWNRTPARIERSWGPLVRHLRAVRPDIVHCCLPHACLLGALAARLSGVDHVITSRREVHAKHGLDQLVYRSGMCLADGLSDRVISVCQAAMEQAIGEGTPRRKSVVIYNALDIPSTAPARQGLFGPGPVFGSVGELRPSKGHRYLLDAMPAVLRAYPNARLVLVGMGSEYERLAAQAGVLGIAGHVTFLGERLDVAALLPELDIFVLPSLREGMPNVVLEAMVSGLPVIATRVGGVPELIDDGVTGILTEPGNGDALARAMMCLAADEDARRRFGVRGRDDVTRRFGGSEREIAAYEAMYQQLLAKKTVRS